jgi:hypothetical protein
VNAVEIRVRVIPRAKRDEVAGERDGALLVRVSAPPVEGRANAAVCRLIAGEIGVAPSKVSVVRGGSAREKVVRIEGVDEALIRAVLRPRA